MRISHVFEIVTGAINARGEFIEVRSLGRWLRKIEGRVHSGHVIRCVREFEGRGNRYALKAV